mmetsp:Transcript_14789/g.19301  ORF Transcript_14789/g.19301 Transcript_14789/m.19301 type:complete len:433 (-) Transcript_14789:259-1557(-)|eukprot:CAMPEP_0116063146 /NCGR_PEP_ID=MMETSP0322-20121206/8234_1 /TAXON_ID=163516 /ORGANISM="Leptocylindrus danicus var. apora, Strain B651" /LENGTH=432 /DNA_ID=CAMNT_0003548695 /DNA_START=174 /DNA_END=1472 /DNA_ORIENTATION=+
MQIFHVFILILIQCSFILIHTCCSFVSSSFVSVSAFAGKRYHHHHHHHRYHQLFAVGDLSTSYEWLANERGFHIEWMDPEESDDGCSVGISASSIERDYDDGLALSEIPVYPLDACYLPICSSKSPVMRNEEDYAILRNVEPRNVKMAQDLIQKNEEDRVFCAVMRANDTGRIATVGTLMRIVSYDEQLLWDGTIARIVLKCKPEKLVHIVRILNPEAWSRENRIKMSNEYLLANLLVMNVARDQSKCMTYKKTQDQCADIIKMYDNIKQVYESVGAGTVSADVKKRLDMDDLPPFALEALSSLPIMTSISVENEHSFWSAAFIWQKVCFTVREAKRINLQALINELTIEVAMKSGGPLNLPVHREDLPFEKRMELNQIEHNATQEFISKSNMDPSLNFQHLLSVSSTSERISSLHRMLSMEYDKVLSSVKS